MPKDSHLYDTGDRELYLTDGYSGTDTDIDNTERFGDDIDLTVNTEAAVDFKFDGSDATDDLVLTIYKRRDSSWTGNEDSWRDALTVANDGTETEYHYTITKECGAGHYRWGMKSAGSTTTFEMDSQVRTSRMTTGIG